MVFAVALAVGGLALGFAANPGVGLAGVVYLALQAVYTPVLKHTAILDVMSISAGFVIRALAGVAAGGRPISPWLDRESVVLGKRGEFGGRRIIKKKKK